MSFFPSAPPKNVRSRALEANWIFEFDSKRSFVTKSISNLNWNVFFEVKPQAGCMIGRAECSTTPGVSQSTRILTVIESQSILAEQIWTVTTKRFALEHQVPQNGCGGDGIGSQSLFGINRGGITRLLLDKLVFDAYLGRIIAMLDRLLLVSLLCLRFGEWSMVRLKM